MARPKPARLYPASLDLRGVPVLVVGGGAVAARKAAALLAAQACLTVVAPDFARAFGALARQAGLKQVRRPFRASDLQGQTLVFAATDDLALNRHIADQARRRKLWVNVAAPGEAGNLQVPAALWRNSVCVAISTGGASAALARTLRERVAQAVGPEWGQLASLLEARRERILEQIAEPAARRGLLRRLAGPHWAARLRRHGLKRVAREIDRLIAQAPRRATLSPVGRGPT
ncbi:MAG: bifunctional precorrin-2 dehydrogenase/sirohydrochlorin ferrochelatase [Planctomycetota bacterium]